MPGTLAEAAAAAPSRAGFGSNPNRSTGARWWRAGRLTPGTAVPGLRRRGYAGFVEHRIGALVGERHRPWGGLACEGECVRLAVQSVKKKGVHDVPYLFQKSCDVFLRLRLLTIHPRTLRPSQRLVAVVFGGFAHAFLAGEQFERFDDGFAGLLGVDHGVDFAHFQR